MFKNLKHSLSTLLATVCAAVALASTPASAQQFVVGTGSVGNTYNRQFTEMKNTCGKDLAMVEWQDAKGNSTGALRNIELLVDENKVNGAFVQADILYQKAKNQDLSDIKTLLVLNPETLHFIVKADFAVKQGGTLGIGGTTVPIRELGQITGMTVASSGGGLGSAKQVRLDSEIAYNILEVNDSKAAIAALDKGEAQVALIVGGFPVDYIKSLPKNQYRILQINDTVYAKIKGAYRQTKTAYSNMADGGTASSVTVQSLFVVREYKSQKMVAALSALKSCVLSNLDEIRETTGNHASWRQVKLDQQAQSVWPLYQFPSGKK
jgi:TRAP-type uncharacterized transport system substrate-binding protein